MSVANTLSGHIILAERLNYEERTRYLVLVQANVSDFCLQVSRSANAQCQQIKNRPKWWTFLSKVVYLSLALEGNEV